MSHIRWTERTPHHCRACGGILRAVYVSDRETIVGLECEGCMREQQFIPERKSKYDNAKARNLKIVRDELEKHWHYAVINCRKCGAAVIFRQRPGSSTWLEMRCTMCTWHPIKPTATKAKV